MSRFQLDDSYRRVDGGGAILGGSPLRAFRLGAAGRRVADALEGHGPLPERHQGLTDRLLDAGAIHPVPDETTAGDGPPTDAEPTPAAAQVTVVRPAYGSVGALAFGACPVIVVDDASDPPLHVDAPVTLIRHDTNRGPAAGRNTGLAHVRTPFVAFVDADVDTGGDEWWLTPLLGHLRDERVAAVAPRVASAEGRGWVARYEHDRSPLDLGSRAARVAPGTRVSYVPSAAIVCRVEALRAVGGFDEAMRFGEDVDLVWRLVAAGWRVRYEPRSVVHHAPRATPRELVRQREGYGSSAAPLEARHPGVLAPRLNPWSAAVVAALALRRPAVAAAIAGVTVATLRRRLRWLDVGTVARLALSGHAGAARMVTAEATRTWWPLGVAALVARPTRATALAAIGGSIIWRWARGSRRLDPVRYVALSLTDDLAYGAGVWRGVLRSRDAAAVIPRRGGYRAQPS